MREWLARLWDWLRRDRLDRELREELAFHAQRLEEEGRNAGLSATDARHQARRRLGSPLGIRESTRDRWSWPWLDHLQQDVRLAVRGLRRDPGFTTAIVIILALGIGANAAMFGVIDRMMLRSPPYLRDPELVNRVYLAGIDGGREQRFHVFEYPRYSDLVRWTSSFEATAVFAPASIAVGTSAGDLREIEAQAVSASFWQFFPVKPMLGRLFGPDEDRAPYGAAVAVIGERFWRTRLASRPDVIGSRIQLGALSATIIGVVPEDFVGLPSLRTRPALFLPVATVLATYGEGVDGFLISIPDQYSRYRNNLGGMEMLVRRKRGVSEAAASADLTNAFRRSYAGQRSEIPELPPIDRLRPRAAVGPVLPDRCAIARRGPCDAYGSIKGSIALWVGALSVVVLLIACANTTNLLLARAARRRREIAMRIALGVSRARLVRQEVTETTLLGLLACGIALVTAEGTSAIFARLFLPAAEPFSILRNPRAVLVALGVAIAAAAVIGSVSPLRGDRGDLVSALRGRRVDGNVGRRARSILVAVQAALSVLLLVTAGLFVRSFHRASATTIGYDPTRITQVWMHLRGKSLSTPAKIALLRQLDATASAIPGVIGVTQATPQQAPINGGPGLVLQSSDSVVSAYNMRAVSPAFVKTMGLQVLAGRFFGFDDRHGAPPVAVVSQAMAGRLWPGASPLGQCIRVGDARSPCTTIIGVVQNVRQLSVDLADDRSLDYYLPIDQLDITGQALNLLIATEGKAREASERIRSGLQPLMPPASFIEVLPLDDRLATMVSQWEVGSKMFLALGLMALGLGAFGLYSVIAYLVVERSHELGVRMAIGARGSDLLRLVIGDGLRVTIAGVAVGSVVAIAATRWLEPLLFRTSASDPLVFVVVGALLLATAVLASLLPAIRASRVDPNLILRGD